MPELVPARLNHAATLRIGRRLLVRAVNKCSIQSKPYVAKIPGFCKFQGALLVNALALIAFTQRSFVGLKCERCGLPVTTFLSCSTPHLPLHDSPAFSVIHFSRNDTSLEANSCFGNFDSSSSHQKPKKPNQVFTSFSA